MLTDRLVFKIFQNSFLFRSYAYLNFSQILGFMGGKMIPNRDIVAAISQLLVD
jgi:hypothetical protein